MTVTTYTHKTYEVYHPYWDNWKPFKAYGPEQAARKAAEYIDSNGDYTIAGGGEDYVGVKSPGNGLSVEFFSISGYSTVVYNATPVEAGNIPDSQFRESYTMFLESEDD